MFVTSYSYHAQENDELTIKTSNVRGAKEGVYGMNFLLQPRYLDIIGQSVAVHHNFNIEAFEKIYFYDYEVEEDDIRKVFFPLHMHAPWSNQSDVLDFIVKSVAKTLSQAHEENFSVQETLRIMVQFRSQVRSSYYRYLKLPTYVPKLDREEYKEWHELYLNMESDHTDVNGNPYHMDIDEYIQFRHIQKMQIFIAQDSYDVLKTVIPDADDLDDIPCFLPGHRDVPPMLKINEFKRSIAVRADEDSEEEEESDDSEHSSVDEKPLSSLKTKPTSKAQKKNDVRQDIEPDDIDMSSVLKKAFTVDHIGRTINVRKLLADFPRLTSTLEKEADGHVEMGMLMLITNIDFANGGSMVFYVNGGTRLTQVRSFFRMMGLLSKRAHDSDPVITPKLKKWNKFRGKEGVAIADKFPTLLKDCAMFGNFSLSPPQSSLSEVQMVKYVNVLFIHKPIDDNMRCQLHPKGCGSDLQLGENCIVDAGECQLVMGRVWNVAVRARVAGKDGLRMDCKVGIVRCRYDQLHLIGNRSGIITKIEPSNHGKTTTQSIRSICHGYAVLTFTDVVGGFSPVIEIDDD